MTPVEILRTILCANPTAEQILAALAANGFEIVPAGRKPAPDMVEWIVDDPMAFVREVIDRRGISLGALAIAAKIAPSTLTRALNDPSHKFTLSTKTIQKIREWDRSQ